jgi:hypothetical protein
LWDSAGPPRHYIQGGLSAPRAGAVSFGRRQRSTPTAMLRPVNSATLQNRMNDCNSRQVVFCAGRLRSCGRRARPWASGSNAIAVTIPTSVAYCPPNGPEKGTWRGASVTRPTATSERISNVELPVCACRPAVRKDASRLRGCNMKRAMTLL